MTKQSAYMISDGIDISHLLSAFDQFHQAIQIAKSDLEKAGTIQYFEFTFELSWKTLKRILAARGKIQNSPKNVFREAALEGLIDDPEIWFTFIENRNETTHIYERSIAEKIYQSLPLFDSEVSKLVSRLKKLK